MTALEHLAMPAPRWGTQRNPARETLGPAVARVAEMLGFAPIMPWQRYVLDVGCEIDPATGLFWYREVNGLVPRQSGKTTILIAKGTHRALTTDRGRIVYTAQDRNKALERLEENFYAPMLETLAPVLLPMRDNRRPGWVGRVGSERIRFITLAQILIDAITRKSGHGGTNDEWLADELFAHRDSTVAQNIRPTLATRPNAQIWGWSAAGKKGESEYWWNKMLAGRAITEQASPSARVAYFEWSDIDPTDGSTALHERDDPAGWRECMPALGWTIAEQVIAAELEGMLDEPEEFDRAYRGIWTGDKPPDPVIPVDSWTAIAWRQDSDPIDWTRPPMWCIDMSPDAEYTSIGVAGSPMDSSDGHRVAVRLVDHELGNAWAIDRLRDLRKRFGGHQIAIAGDGRAMALKQDLEDDGWEVLVVPTKEVAAACGAIYDDSVNARMWHGNDDDLNSALAGAAKRNYGDAWKWWRGRSMTDVSPLYAVTLARYKFLSDAVTGYDPLLGR